MISSNKYCRLCTLQQNQSYCKQVMTIIIFQKDNFLSFIHVSYYGVAQRTSSTHFCERQRFESIYTSWENPRNTTYASFKEHICQPFKMSSNKPVRGPPNPECMSPQAIPTPERSMGSLYTLPSNTYPNSTIPSSSPKEGCE